MADDLPLSFDGPLLVVGGGRFAPDLLVGLAQRAAGLVGADSGADAIHAAGLVPDAVIGDMDSVFDPMAFGPKTRVIAFAEQDTTDFEKCLYATRAPLTIALGMTGGRLDHTLAALHAVARHADARRIVLVEENDMALGVAGSIALEVGKGSRVSLYPLDGLVMEQGRQIGTSNLATADRITIEVAEGPQDPWLLIVDKRLLGLLL